MCYGMQTGLLLVVGSILAAIGFVLYPADSGEGAAAIAQAMLNDPTTGKIAVLMGYGGVIAVLIGLFGISRSMALAGGAGTSYTSIAMVLFVALVAGFVAGFGLEYGSTEAGSVVERSYSSGCGAHNRWGSYTCNGCCADLVWHRNRC